MNALMIPAEELNLVDTIANRSLLVGARDEADDAGGRRLQQMFHVEPARHAAPAPSVPTRTVLA